MTKSRSHEEAKLASFRQDPEYASEYLNAVLEDGDQEELLETLRFMTQAFGGVPSLAGETDLNATTLYRTLSTTMSRFRDMNVNTKRWFFLVSRLPVILVLGCLWSGLAPAGEGAASSPLSSAPLSSEARSPVSPALDLGTQPLGYPSGVISAVIARDRILRNALAAANEPLQIHPFRSGAEMVALLADGRLEAGLLGDMPTLLAACTGQVRIIGLVKQATTMLIAKGTKQVQDLAGKRIGYVAESSAHLALLQGLATAGLGEDQVRLVPLPIDAMPAALDDGTIEAFAAWEPAPAIALSHSRENRIVFQTPSADYFVIGQTFASRSPEAALQLTASLVRALDWLRRSRDHREQAARWTLADAAAFSGPSPSISPPVSPPISVAQLVTITQRDILTIPSAPAIQRRPDRAPLQSEFKFLERRGKLPAGATWAGVVAAFDDDEIAQVLAAPWHYQLGTFDYAD